MWYMFFYLAVSLVGAGSGDVGCFEVENWIFGNLHFICCLHQQFACAIEGPKGVRITNSQALLN